MALFGRTPLSFFEGVSDPYATSAGPEFAMPQPKPKEPPRRRGLFGRLGETFTPDRLQLLAAAFHDMGHGTNTFSDVSAGQFERRAYKDEQAQRLSDRNDAAKRRQRLVDWAAGTADPTDDLDPEAALTQRMRQTGERDQYAWQRTYDTEHPEAITPYQQAQLDLTRRGQDVSRANSQDSAANRPPPALRGADARQLTRVQQAGEGARQMRGLVTQFWGANRNTGSGPIGQWTQYFSGDQAAMRAAASQMRGLMRPIGSGATSDYEQRLYAQGAPDPGLPGPANEQRMRNIIALTDIANARQDFFEAFADQNGTTLGAEQAFQASPQFRRLTQSQQAAAQGGGPPPGGEADITIDENGNRIQR